MLEDQRLRNVLAIQAIATLVLIVGLVTALTGTSESEGKEEESVTAQQAVYAGLGEPPESMTSAGSEAK